MPHRIYAIVEAPSVLGLKPTGVERLLAALLRHGLAVRLRSRSTTPLVPPAYDPEIDPATHTLNAEAIVKWSPELADAVENVLDLDEFPVVLGGDCSILLGCTLALRRRGRYGLLFVDGHAEPACRSKGKAAEIL